MAASKRTALILTSALSNGAFSLVSWKSFSGNEGSLRIASHLALSGSKSSWAQSLIEAINDKNNPLSPLPILFHDKHITGATYHHGTDHAHYIIGPLNSVLRVCSSSENEREVALQFARQQTTLGHVCYGIAQGHSNSDVRTVNQFVGQHKLDFLGVVVVKPILYPNTLHRLSSLFKRYDILHYLATGDEYYTSALAVQAKLLAPTEEIITKNSPVPRQQSAVLFLPERDYNACIKSNTYDHTFDSPLS
ncbi:hypothetical protein H7Y29_00810 [Microbacteriaceae bacterium]|nr:hypothetical protein [Candidatus Saccharibacteria bacterium]